MPLTFAALGAPAAMVGRLEDRGITEPFPIQAATLPDALAGRDVCGRAPTGSGKTIAFGIPLIARVKRAESKRPRALVLVPTRELAAQVGRELRMLAGRDGPTITTVYGGVGFGPQVQQLRKGVQIVVACPGRLADLVAQGHLSLERVEFVVIDEADRMADMGFLPEVRRLLDTVSPKRQTLLFSATLDGDVDVLVKRYQKNPSRHELVVEDSSPVSRHVFWKTDRSERVNVLVDVVTSHAPAIVFCRTKHGVDRLAKQLTRAGVAAAVIHGGRSQGQRDRALASFTSGQLSVLVATDVAARGIHVDDVAIVVHFDPPGTEKDYVHRSGRTGRAGETGLVLSLLDPTQQKDAAALQRRLGLESGTGQVDLAALAGTDHRPPRKDRRQLTTNAPRRTAPHGRARRARGRPTRSR